jgi:hypothetical protein
MVEYARVAFDRTQGTPPPVVELSEVQVIPSPVSDRTRVRVTHDSTGLDGQVRLISIARQVRQEDGSWRTDAAVRVHENMVAAVADCLVWCADQISAGA